MPMPMGMKMRPMMKKVGSTVPAVRMGCQAGSRCCLKAVLSGLRVLAVPPEDTGARRPLHPSRYSSSPSTPRARLRDAQVDGPGHPPADPDRRRAGAAAAAAVAAVKAEGAGHPSADSRRPEARVGGGRQREGERKEGED